MDLTVRAWWKRAGTPKSGQVRTWREGSVVCQDLSRCTAAMPVGGKPRGGGGRGGGQARADRDGASSSGASTPRPSIPMRKKKANELPAGDAPREDDDDCCVIDETRSDGPRGVCLPPAKRGKQ